jgi:hypothetical protein
MTDPRDLADLHAMAASTRWSWHEYRAVEKALPELLARLRAAEARGAELEERTRLTKVNQKNLLTFDSMANLITRQAERIVALTQAARAIYQNWVDQDGHCWVCRETGSHADDCTFAALAALVGEG